MRPLRLEMQGFSAFRDRTVVDFTDVELVALVGATGSGKSSIIDAMTFALYGSVSRYDERVVAPVVNQLSTEARVRFDFEVAGATYTATRVVRRTKTGATTKEARLERGGEVLAGDPRALDQRVTELLGLDLTRFNKTVVLPQGRFADFLHDKPAARDDLLRELLGLGVYQRIATAARDRAAQLKNRADVLEQTDTIDPASVSDERLALLQQRATAVGEARDGVGRADEELAEITTEGRDAAARVVELDARRQLVAAVAAPAGIRALQSELDAAHAAAVAADAALVRARVARHSAAVAVAEGPAVGELQLLRRDHREHDELADRLAGAQDRAEIASSSAASAIEHAASARAQLAAAEAAVAHVRSEADAAEARRRAAPERAAVEAALSAHTRHGEQAAALGALQVDQAAAADDEQVAAAARQHAHEVLTRAERLAPAALLAAELSLGEPCPVCYQVVHALPLTTGAGDDLGPLQAAARTTDDDHRRAGAAHAAARARAEQATAAVERLAAEMASAPDAAALEAQLVQVAELAAAADAARAAVGDTERVLQGRRADPEVVAALDAERAAQAELTRADTTLDDVKSRLTAAAAAVQGRPSAAVATEELARAQTLSTAHDAAAGAERASEAAAERAADERAAVLVREQRARRDYEARRDELAALAPPVPEGTLAACWNALVAWAATVARRLAAEHADAVSVLDGHRARATALQARAAELAAPFVAVVRGPVARWREELAEAHVAVRRDIAQLRADRARRAALVAEIATLRHHEAVATELGRLLRVDGFQRWLLEEAVADLVARATVRLRELTSGQYSLTARRGSFEVVDHRNADEVRDARSLSGGETFLTSLALALALADSSTDLAAQGAAPLESIFLDEGFGTLDPDALDVVAATIEELGARGRMVGIVTHIRELAERMPTRFEVTKGPSSSSVERVDA